jgi:hypothetical protein
MPGTKGNTSKPGSCLEKAGLENYTEGIEVVGKESADTWEKEEEEACIDDAGAKESHQENFGIDSGPEYDWTGPEREPRNTDEDRRPGNAFGTMAAEDVASGKRREI